MAFIDYNSVDILTGSSSHGVMKRGFFSYASPSYSSTNRYFHFKTNIIGGAIMTMVEAKGTHYGASARIHSRWVFYSYHVGSLINRNFHNIGGTTGLVTGGTYLSTDNYVVIWGEMSATSGDCNFTLNAIHPCPTGSRYGIGITAYTTTTSSSGAY